MAPFKDDHSGFCAIYCIKTKSSTFDCLRWFYGQMLREAGYMKPSIRYLILANFSEFCAEMEGEIGLKV